MKKMFRNKKGITMITLTITIIVLMILLNVITYNAASSIETVKYQELEADITTLQDKSINFYSEFGNIPANKNYEYTNISAIQDLLGANDIGKFYVLDLSAIENLTLNYGEEFENYLEIINNNLTDQEKLEKINELEDIYIINETSYNIFYVRGIDVAGIMNHTTDSESEIDKEKVEIRIIDGVVIPQGCTFVSKNSSGTIVIKENTTDEEYVWIRNESELTTVPSIIGNINSTNEEEFLGSANKYGGYYISSSSNNALYIK